MLVFSSWGVCLRSTSVRETLLYIASGMLNQWRYLFLAGWLHLENLRLSHEALDNALFPQFREQSFAGEVIFHPGDGVVRGRVFGLVRFRESRPNRRFDQRWSSIVSRFMDGFESYAIDGNGIGLVHGNCGNSGGVGLHDEGACRRFPARGTCSGP